MDPANPGKADALASDSGEGRAQVAEFEGAAPAALVEYDFLVLVRAFPETAAP